MKIAQVAPLYESVPPAAYGGTERVVSWLTEELVRQGEEVTLFASADSITSARLVPCAPRSLRGNRDCVDALCHHFVMLENVSHRRDEFDIVHFHTDYLHFPISRRENIPQITTLHGRLDLADLIPLYTEYPEMPVVSISMKQREPLSFANWVGNVYHGLPKDSFSFHPEPNDYLVFIGRISPEKRVDRVIEIADRAGMRVRIAAKVDKVDLEYFETVIKPLLKNPRVEFLGEVNESEKDALLGQAVACLYPIDWPEPFGLAMIEAMACGTPTIAFRNGSVPEIIENAVNGYVVESVDEAVDAVSHIREIPRAGCRKAFEKRFTDVRMAADYLRIYGQQIKTLATTSTKSLEPRLEPTPLPQ